jgi:NTE family protein
MAQARPKVALVLTGGGARAAYQVGVLRALAEIIPDRVANPFPIICGTSAGAINATALAADAADFRRAVRRLMYVWKNFQVSHVYRADPWGAFYNSARWILGVASGGLFTRGPVSLLDNAPLVELLHRYLDFPAIQRSIDDGHLVALSVTCSGYSSGQSVTFYQGEAALEPWQRARRIGVPMPITLEHLLASSALPFIFPPVHINREYFGDGSMRQIAPVSPALHLGADRLLVIGTAREAAAGPERVKTESFPPLAQIAGHALNSIFLDSLEVDLERMQRINRTIELIPKEVLHRTRYPLHQVDFRMLAPSEPLERLALAHAHELPRTIRILLHSVGALRRSGANVLSYLLFEKSYCRALIRLGYEDTMQREDDLAAFLGWHEA